jgi:hypothetical protein
MKLSVSGLLVLLMVLTGSGTLYAAGQDQANDEVKVQIDGRTIVFPDAKPYSVTTAVYVPVRMAAENMGIPVIWDTDSQSVRIGEGTQVFTFKPERSAGSDKPFLKDNRVFVDLTFIQDKLGAKVNWNQEQLTASIQTKSNVLKGVQLFKQSMVKISGEQVIYVDPYKVDGAPKDADVVFITHTHGDHFNLDEIRKVAKDDATLIFPKKELDKVKDAGFAQVIGFSPNEEGKVKGLTHKTVPAYNVNAPNHPKDREWVGFIININQASYYMAGDTV